MDNRAFLEAIADAPTDDALRLIYADWLEEHGMVARAEFIRVQCALAQKAMYDPSRLPLVKREQALLEEHGAEWARPVAPIVRAYTFHRGFVDSVAIGARKLLLHGEKLFQSGPIRHVKVLRLGSSNVTVADLVGWKLLPRIRSLALQGTLAPVELRTFITAPGLKNLTGLALECPFQAETLQPLLAGCLPYLETLDLSAEESVLTATHIESLAQADWTTALRQLKLKNHAINVGGA